MSRKHLCFLMMSLLMVIGYCTAIVLANCGSENPTPPSGWTNRGSDYASGDPDGGGPLITANCYVSWDYAGSTFKTYHWASVHGPSSHSFDLEFRHTRDLADPRDETVEIDDGGPPAPDESPATNCHEYDDVLETANQSGITHNPYTAVRTGNGEVKAFLTNVGPP